MTWERDHSVNGGKIRAAGPGVDAMIAEQNVMAPPVNGWILYWKFCGEKRQAAFRTRDALREAVRYLKHWLPRTSSKSWPDFSKLRVIRVTTGSKDVVETEYTYVGGEWFASFGGFLHFRYQNWKDPGYDSYYPGYW